ncbi:hypothetical protein N7527_007585 [Penicillium freii]|nr:hypothetical protein N7527_007585 [Penicillium freii]
MAEFLSGLEVTENRRFTLPPRPIVEKLDECAYASTEEDIADGFGPGYVAGKFLCLPAGSNAQEKAAFMRIYKQIPTAGTEFHNPSCPGRRAT